MKTSILSAFLLGLIAGAVGMYLIDKPAPPRVHKLEFPMMLAGATSDRLPTILPKGTSLYYDQAFPEGFVRYKVYINVEGVNLASHPVTEKFSLDPLTAFPLDMPNLRKLLADYPYTREDLSAILRSAQLSKQEISDLLKDHDQ